MFSFFDTETGRIVINVFIVLMLIIIWLYDLPITKMYAPIRTVMDKVLKWTGLSHGWSMFAPNPSDVNRRLTAEFMLSDGQIIEHPVWDFGTLKRFEAVLKGRHRKLREKLIEKSYNILKPSYCHFLVQRFYRDQLERHGVIKDRVVKVWLYDCSSRIPEPGVAPNDEEYFYKSWFFTYEVPKSLEEELDLYK